LLGYQSVAAALNRRVPYSRPGPAPVFQPGDHVRARLPARNAHVPGGHTRLPAYLAGHTGRVVLSHGAHVLPDSNAHGLGEAPEPLYTVAFAAADLWGDAVNPADDVTADLWQSYLTLA
jgi:nitrile hydratase